MKSRVDFKIGRIYLIEQLSGRFWFVGRYLGRDITDTTISGLHSFKSLALSGPDHEVAEADTSRDDKYLFNWDKYSYLYEAREVKTEDLPLYVSADHTWAAFRELIRKL